MTVDDEPIPSRGLNPVQLLFQTPEFAVNPRWPVRDVLCEVHLVTMPVGVDSALPTLGLTDCRTSFPVVNLREFALPARPVPGCVI